MLDLNNLPPEYTAPISKRQWELVKFLFREHPGVNYDDHEEVEGPTEAAGEAA